MLGLGLLVHVLRSRRLWEGVATAAVVAAAVGGLAGLDKESRAKSLARLTAWLKMQDQQLEKKVKDALT